MPSNPEARTRKLFTEMGYVIDGANRYEMYSGRRHDYIGCVDLIAFNDTEIIAIQATSSSNRAARRGSVSKIRPRNVGSPRRIVNFTS
jgi:hypothetical protein